MRPRRIILAACLLLVATSAFSYRLLYKEQLYELNHQQLYMRSEDYAENIRWLELSLRADFANPLYALAEIRNEREWEYYRDLFWMQLNLHLVEQYLGWASDYMKFEAYFYNYPWREDNLESLLRAESLFDIALYYWEEARTWSDRAGEFPWLELEEVAQWADRSYRIQTGDLNYEAIIGRHQARLDSVRAEFEAMNSSTY
jgi:hypothetical protein